MLEELKHPAIILTQQERYRLFEILNLFSFIWKRNQNEYEFEIDTIHKNNMIEIGISYLGFNYHDESWDCWEYIRAEKIAEEEFCQGKNSANHVPFEKPFGLLVGIAKHCYVWETTCDDETKKVAYADQIKELPGFYRFTFAIGDNRA